MPLSSDATRDEAASILSPAQRAVLGDAVRVVEAGPGSGKTRALVARFVQTAESSEGGVALLSFTNAAVDEVRNRTRGSSRLLQAPHFVGTIDSFLHRFIVTPAEIKRLGRQPTYLASWSDLGDAQMLRLKGLAGASGIPLSSFLMDENRTVSLTETTLKSTERAYLKAVDEAGRRNDLVDYAKKRISSYVRAGIWDSNTARVKACALINTEAGTAILQRLGRRFCEFLVDEAQDCDAAEMNIFRQLALHSRLIVVADPDQAIFEFRGGHPDLFCSYRDEQPEDARVFLDLNYRSTEAICAAVTSLRAAGEHAVEAACSEPGAPVMVLKGTPEEQRMKFEEELASAGLATYSAVVLSHRLNTARATTGLPADPQTSALGNQLALAAARLASDSASVAERLAAIRSVERMVLSLVLWDSDEESVGTGRQLDILGQRPDWLRLVAAGLISTVKNCDAPDSFGVSARGYLNESLADLPRKITSLGSRLKKPDATCWKVATAPHDASTLRFGTVHSAKGKEYEAVLLAMPKTGPHPGLDAWEAGMNSEERRVLYVGASRARSLLAFGGGLQADRIAKRLDADGVPVLVR